MTITVRLPDELEAKLKARLEAGEIELSEYVRQAIAEKLERDPAAPDSGADEAKASAEPDSQTKPTAFELGKHLFGRYGSGRDDLSENLDAILRGKLRAKHRR